MREDEKRELKRIINNAIKSEQQNRDFYGKYSSDPDEVGNICYREKHQDNCNFLCVALDNISLISSDE